MSNRDATGSADAFRAKLRDLEDRVKLLERPQARTAGVQQFGSQLQVGDFMLEQVTLPGDAVYPTTPQLRVRNVKTGFNAKLPVGAFAQQINLAAPVTVAQGGLTTPGNVVPPTLSLPKAARYHVGFGVYFTSTAFGWGFAAASVYYSAPNQGITNRNALNFAAVLGDAGQNTFNGTATGTSIIDTRGITMPVTLALGFYKNAAGGNVLANAQHSWLEVVEIA